MQIVLNQSKDYNKVISVRDCPNIKMYELLIQSQWLGAKNPNELQTEFKGLFTKEEMTSIVDVLQKAI